jgi:hypothetical protein
MKTDQIDDLRSVLRSAEALANTIREVDGVLDDANRNPSKSIEDIIKPLSSGIKNRVRVGFLDAIKTYRDKLAAELADLHYSTNK